MFLRRFARMVPLSPLRTEIAVARCIATGGPPASVDARPFGEGLSSSRAASLPPSASELPESSFLKCIQKEIDDEDLRLDKDCPPLPSGWTVAHDEGAGFWCMNRTWVSPTFGTCETHRVRVQLTARDPSLDPECDVRGEHIPFTILVESDAHSNVIDLSCDVVEGELVVDNIRVYEASRLASDPSAAAAIDRGLLYPGPNLDEAEEPVLDGIQAWLAERQFDDQFGEFLGHYSIWIEQLEYERWLKLLKSFVAA